MHRFLTLFFLAFLLTISAAGADITVGSEARSSHTASIYTDFAIIHDTRDVVLPKGEVNVDLVDVLETLRAETVNVRSDHRKGYVSTQQSYRFDALNRRSLLEQFIGKKLKYSRTIRENSTFEKVLREGILLSINPEIVQFGDVIEIQPEGTISLPYIPDTLATSPTVRLQGGNDQAGVQALTLSYHARGLGWQAHYRLTTGKDGALTGWVSVRNDSHLELGFDQIWLVAGAVAVVDDHQPEPRQFDRGASMMESVAVSATAVPEAFSDYHRYQFPDAVRLAARQTTQLRLLEASDIKLEKIYRLVSHVQRYNNQAEETGNPDVVYRFNTGQAGFEQPLPAGVMDVYTDDDEFIGGDWVSHTAVGEDVELITGQAFNLVVERRQLRLRKTGERSVQVSYELTVRNSGDESATVELQEQLFGDWEIVSKAKGGRRLDAQTYQIQVKVPSNGERTVGYAASLTW